MGLLVSIDNGGTLTDVCATDGTATIHVKTITTPHDLTECFVKGLEALAERVLGEPDLLGLVAGIDTIRYSTTQGTNAIVQRRGPRLGLLVDDGGLAAAATAASPELFAAFVGPRVRTVPPAEGEAHRLALIAAVAELVSAGASRIVVALSGEDSAEREKAVGRVLYKAFPRHLLGAVPLLFSTELARVGTAERRVWAALVNAFLHPAMEQFLYNAENRLRDARARKPLLIFRNDGTSSRVAKTVAVKTYSSGPQGGVVGAEVLLRHYGIAQAVSIDIGGTTTDIAVFDAGRVAVEPCGSIEGAPMPFPMARIHSIGVGGGSIIRGDAATGRIAVGPQSVGSAPGPACFGRGGSEATITDAFLADGILDPHSYFGGRLTLDRERADRAIAANVAEPLDLDAQGAVESMIAAYDGAIARTLVEEHGVAPGRVLLAFGGAGPMSACGIAEQAGLDTVLIPRFAAVFSAFGIAFSDIQHSYVAALAGADPAAVQADLREQARRGMLAEGFDLADCTLEFAALEEVDGAPVRQPLDTVLDRADGRAGCWMELRVTRAIPRMTLGGTACEPRRQAAPVAVREGRRALPLYRLEELQPGDWGHGPCLVEEAFFTTLVKDGWRFVVSDNGDLFLRR